VIAYDGTGALIVVVVGEPDAGGAASTIAYSGRFELAEWRGRDGVVEGVVLHHMDAASDPLLLEDEPEREFVLRGDTLSIGDGETYRRVLRRRRG
jgi:hypothetical protein